MKQRQKNISEIRGFSLLELIVVLVIITMLATFSVPQVNLWVAQNRARRAIVQLIGDFNRARILAAGTSVLKTNEMISRRPLTALHFPNSQSYRTIQRLGTNLFGWGASASDVIVRSSELHHSVSFVTINGVAAGANNVIIFTPSKQIMNMGRAIITTVADANTEKCGTIDNPLKDNRVFQVVLKSDITETVSMYYYINIGPGGEHYVCANDTTNFATGGKELDV
jgi:prepilin-type N-terminal cleavage/methylation domain-containing protein